MSPQQIFMLKMFADGWGFKLFNKKPGSWNTYWALRRKGYVSSVQSGSPLMCGLSEWERKGLIALYTHPQAPLTDAQKWRLYESGADMPDSMAAVYMRGIADAEAAHGITGEKK